MIAYLFAKGHSRDQEVNFLEIKTPSKNARVKVASFKNSACVLSKICPAINMFCRKSKLEVINDSHSFTILSDSFDILNYNAETGELEASGKLSDIAQNFLMVDDFFSKFSGVVHPDL